MASSLFNLRAWQSSRTTSFQVFFGLPLGLEPSTSSYIHFFTQSSSSFRNTWPYQHSLFCCYTNAMSSSSRGKCLIFGDTQISFFAPCRTGGRKLACQNQLDSFSHFDRTPTCDRQTDGHRAMASTGASRECRAGKTRGWVASNGGDGAAFYQLSGKRILK